MRKRTTNNGQNKIPEKALALLRSEPGSFARVARKCGVGRAHIAMVVAGRRRSARVRVALLREARKIAIWRAMESAAEFDALAKGFDIEGRDKF